MNFKMNGLHSIFVNVIGNNIVKINCVKFIIKRKKYHFGLEFHVLNIFHME